MNILSPKRLIAKDWLLVFVLGLASFLLDIGIESVINFDREGHWTGQLPLIFAGITGAAIPVLVRKDNRRGIAILIFTIALAAVMFFVYAFLFVEAYENVPLSSLIFESIMGFLIPIPIFFYIAKGLLKRGATY